MFNWQEWLQMLVCLVIIIGFFQMLLPDGQMQRLVKLVMGLVIMLAVMQPILAVLNTEWLIPTSLSWPTSDMVSSPDWNDQAEEIMAAGSKPVFSHITSSTEHQLEAILLINQEISDAKVEITVNHDGVVQSADVTVKTAKEVDEEQHHLLIEQNRTTISRYLQLKSTDVRVTINQ